jgi:hypothetical protein
MTAAIVGIFILRHYGAEWGWYVAVVGMAFLEGYHTDNARSSILSRLGDIRIALGNLTRPNHYDED